MINPEDIDPFELAFTSIVENTTFPPNPAIYFVIDSTNKIQYIGQTAKSRIIKVKEHWKDSECYEELARLENAHIHYLYEAPPGIEAALIQRFDPPLNKLEEQRKSQQGESKA